MLFDFLIVGGGVVGCSVLNKLTRLGQKCLLLEKQPDISTNASKANSGIVHAGFDAKENTLKAKLNVRGNILCKTLCEELSVPIKNCGALVVASEKDELEKLLLRGKVNCVDEISIIEKDQILKLVPDICDEINFALYAKSSAVFSPYIFTVALAEESVLNGAEIKLEEKPIKIEKKQGYFNVFTQNNEYFAKKIINCAGSNFNEVAKLLKTEEYDIKFRRGEYCLLDKTACALTPITIFPLPSKKGKGVIISPTVDGNVILGPTSIESDTSTKTTDEGLDYIFSEAKKILKNIPFNKTIRTYAGIRTIVGDDFIVEKSKIDSDVICVCGICSPGLTSAPAIAEMIAVEILGLEDKEIQMKKRTPILKFSNLTQKERNELIKKNPDYGKIVCRCECVSLAEIKQALASPVCPNTVDAVKRRTRAGMGRCQGGYCMASIIEELAKSQNCKIEEIKKELTGSNVVYGDIRK